MSVATPYTEAWISGPRDTRFYTRMYQAERPTAALVFLHGAAEHAGRYTDMHRALAEQSISVFVFDLRGFGKTALDKDKKSKNSAYGKTDGESQLDDAEWAIEHVQAELGDLPIFLMGTSMGGGLVLGLMCDPLRSSHKSVAALRGIIAGSPCVTITKAPPKAVVVFAKSVAAFKPYLLYPVRNKPEDLSHNPETNAQYLADPLIKTPGSLRGILDMLGLGAHILSSGYANWPKNMPVLFLHGTTDPGAHHELHNEPDGVREKSLADIVAFIKLHLR
ncbi:Alpha/Beta hydrolase protein [Mycena vulgaris]|nr:Alpha/Beta hydrolase protein [Mycena vulgaris]